MKQVMEWNGAAKISVSLKGHGEKCFRHAESPVNAVMAMDTTELAWAYPWIDNVNCLMLRGTIEEKFQRLFESTQHADLYEIYLNSVHNIRYYQRSNYVLNHLQSKIEKAFPVV